MAKEKSIQIDNLPEAAQRELLDFYEYLVDKYQEPVPERKKKSGRLAADKARFFEHVHSLSFRLPKEYHFNRDALHER